ncbi:helix-turn-helix transcriptional regulator [Rhodococcus sp. MS13]|uniref:helix-turn-helix domain-containing protein n=1 Tax=Rhodococcus sp. MS13 TaxID=2579940 RepID=UPI00156211BC|nr:helix-turn-helix transcriptional regulator [Rhodococcus sp. MS13]NRH32782.1 helix-turn-helix transcriptional regulator [Rhodococcus sp. MS13]
MSAPSTGARIEKARLAAQIASRRELADKAGISVSTLSRIIAGTQPAKANELLAIAMATGCPLAELIGICTMAEPLQCGARPDSGANFEEMREQLLQFFELNSYLDEQGISVRQEAPR